MKYKLGIFSDPHIGLERRAHTTANSRKMLKNKLADTALNCVKKLDANFKACLGDLFDTSHNTETTIMQGLLVANECDFLLGGNHDVPNREGTVCSLQIVEKGVNKNIITVPVVGQSLYTVQGTSDFISYAIPHQSSQELFDKAVMEVCEEPENEGKLEVVFLHCNYECGFADNEISLNLTSKQADLLLEKFDYIFIGHEHESRVLKDERLFLVGNIHPTSFADIGDKFIWYIDEDNDIVQELVWDMSEKYKLMTLKELPQTVSELEWLDAEFIQVDGYLSQEDYASVADFMVKMWAANPQALMIRNNLKVIEGEEVVEGELTNIDNLPSHIAEELKGDEGMKDLWNDYVERVGEKDVK